MKQNWLQAFAARLGIARRQRAPGKNELDKLLAELLGGVVREKGLDEHGRFVAVVEASPKDEHRSA